MTLSSPLVRYTLAPPLRYLYSVVGGLALISGLVISPAAPAVAADRPGDSLHWGPCPKSAEMLKEYPTECATFSVPMDYKKPKGKKITLTMSRMKSQGPRRGVIFTNPGGPGGQALNLWNWIVDKGAGKALWKNYDLIAVQPRGLTSATALLPCTTEEELEKAVQETAVEQSKKDRQDGVAAAQFREDTTSVVDELSEEIKNLFSKDSSQAGDDQGCLSEFMEYFRTVNTENTARDFDMARQFLGENIIHYYGASYGTYLGAVYLSLFPQHSGRFVLDSAINPEWVWLRGFEAQADAQRQRLYEIFEFIADHDNIYHLGDTPLKVYTKWYTIVNREVGGFYAPRIAAPPARVGDVPPAFAEAAEEYLQAYNAGRPVADRFEHLLKTWLVPPFINEEKGQNLWSLTSAGYTSRRNWPKIAYYMQHGSIDEELYHEDEVANLATSGTVFTAVVCNENAIAPKVLNLPGAVTGYFMGEDMFEVNKRLITSGALCALFPPTTKPVKVENKHLKYPPLVLQSLNDTQTVYSEGAHLAQMLNAYFVTADGGDHGVYVQHSPQAWKLTNDYLDGKPVTQQYLPYAEVQKLIYQPKNKK